jgi:hypothetical protein
MKPTGNPTDVATGFHRFRFAGYGAELSIATDHLEQLTIGLRNSRGKISALFSILIRPSGSYIWFPKGNGLYRVGRPERLWELADDLVREHAEQSEDSDGRQAVLFRIYGMERVKEWQFLEEAQARDAELNLAIGWRPLTDCEDEQFWNLVFKQFWRSPQGPSHFNVPKPWVTWSFQEQRTKAWHLAAVTRVMRDLWTGINLMTLKCLRHCIRKGEFAFFLDHNHQGYAFDPHEACAKLYARWWPSSLMPCGNRTLFTVADVSIGVYTDPVDGSILCSASHDCDFSAIPRSRFSAAGDRRQRLACQRP